MQQRQTEARGSVDFMYAGHPALGLPKVQTAPQSTGSDWHSVWLSTHLAASKRLLISGPAAAAGALEAG